MKLTFLGTGGAEGWPGMFCNCEHCKRARAAGGKNLRTRTQALVNQDLLIDFPSDTYTHVVRNNLEFSLVRWCLITHSHPDHYAPSELCYHTPDVFAYEMTENQMDVYGNERISALWENFRMAYPDENPNMGITLHIVKAYETFTLGDYEITPLPAVHAPKENAFVYLIRDGKNTLLYLHDTGVLMDETINWLADRQIKADLITYDCTRGIKETCPGHMNLELVSGLHKRFMELGIASEQTIAVINHFSHDGGLIYDEMKPTAEKEGFVTSYDGMTVEF